MLGQYCIGILSRQCFLNTSNIAQENYICNVGPERIVIFLQENDLYNVVLIYLGWHCTIKLPVQCWATLHKQLSTWKQFTIFAGFIWANIAQGHYLCTVDPWLTNNFCEENNLYNVVLTMLGQHCIGILSSHCCPNTSETCFCR